MKNPYLFFPGLKVLDLDTANLSTVLRSQGHRDALETNNNFYACTKPSYQIKI